MKKVSFQLNDQQYASYEKAAEQLLALGIPSNPQALIQIMTANQSADEVTHNFLNLMKSLVATGKKEFRKKQERGQSHELD